MKIILAPSKTQKLECPLTDGGRSLLYELKSRQLMDILNKIDKDELGQLFKIKGKLLDDTYELYHKGNHDLRYDPIGCYDGVVYEALGNRVFGDQEIKYMEEHLVIISAMFGIVEPGMGIWPSGLDFKTRPGGLNLYSYWQDEVLEYFRGVDVVINLASEEFSSILKPISDRMLNINFLESDNRCLSYRVKKARGLLADEIIGLKLENIDDLKNLVIDGYIYNDKRSDAKNYYYIKGGR